MTLSCAGFGNHLCIQLLSSSQVKDLFDRAVLIPSGYLNLLPLHAAWTEDSTRPTGRRYALDDIHFTYAPNAQALTTARAISDRVRADSILSIDKPRNDLPNSEQEVQAAIATFPRPTVLRHHQATVDQVRSQLTNAAIAHFSCHGTTNLNQPFNSGLRMSDGIFALKDIFALNLAILPKATTVSDSPSSLPAKPA
jgi:CHAT domain-containing protein